VPVLIVSARGDGYLPPADARELLRRAGSSHKQLALFPGNYHGWDLLSAAPYHAKASRVVIDFLHRYS
jgi:dienelactone hydrolase